MPTRLVARFLAGILLSTGVAVAQTTTFSSSGIISIGSALQANPYPSAPIGSCGNGACIIVSGLVGQATDIKLTLNGFSVSNANNLAILLQAPSFAALDVMSNACHVPGSSTFSLTDSGTAQGFAGLTSNCFNSGNWLATTHHFFGFVADNFPSPGPGATSYTRAEPDSNGNNSSSMSDSSNGTGTFAHVFGGLAGANLNGVWRLYVTNQVSGGGTSGSIGSWSLAITTLLAPDADSDGVTDSIDNCMSVSNPDQRDSNADGYGNLCDPDFNNDGTVNINDFNRLKARLNITPVVDGDTDLDGNGAVNINDFNRLKSYLGKPPGPSGLHPNCPPTCP
jgi:hypothetical protein